MYLISLFNSLYGNVILRMNNYTNDSTFFKLSQTGEW